MRRKAIMLTDKTPDQQNFHGKMLADVKLILDKHKVTNILSGSALLGIVRDGDLIPWSPGCILIVKFSDVKLKEFKIIDDLKSAGFKIKRHYKKSSNWKIRVDKGNYNIEITGYDKQRDHYFRSSGKRIKTIPLKYLDNLTKIKSKYGKFICPKDTAGFLTHLYGDWRTVIKSEVRHSYKAETHTRYK
jgi:phosphorylcholine metabolism protein LicD